MHKKSALLRYPGGKQRQLPSFLTYLPSSQQMQGKYIEPFLGGGAVFFQLRPNQAILSDINAELIELYQGVLSDPISVWRIYSSFPSTKDAYYEIRGWIKAEHNLTERAARTLYLNRTCFKGMWRHNANGEFNVGYGGQDRRWNIRQDDLIEVALSMRNVDLRCCDFEEVIEEATEGDFLFLDPPYRPGREKLSDAHYREKNFPVEEQQRLALALNRATSRGVLWAMTNSSHRAVTAHYDGYRISRLPRGTGKQIGHLTASSEEVLIRNYEEI